MIYFSSLLDAFVPDFASGLKRALDDYQVDYLFLTGTKDIWCRDFMPIQVSSKRFIQFSLTRDYYTKRKLSFKTDPRPICEALGIETKPAIYRGEPIYLDGGNIIKSFNKAIMTNKVVTDNNIPEEKVRPFFEELLEVSKVIIIPKEPGELSGHVDGMLRFVDDNTVIINDFSSCITNPRFFSKLKQILKDEGLSINWAPYKPSNETIDGLQPATCVYVNFLQLPGLIFMPTFEDPEVDNKALGLFQNTFRDYTIVPVPSLALSRGGGVLNCISWEIFP